MKVLHCAETARGGIATYLDELLPLQVESEEVSSVLCIVPDNHARDIESVDDEVVHPFFSTPSRALNTLLLVVSVIRVMAWFKPDVVHIHSTFAGIALRPVLAFFRGVKVVYCPHGWSFDRHSTRFNNFVCKTLERALSPLCNTILCISRHEFEIASRAGIDSSKLRLVYNGIADSRPDPKAAATSPWPSSTSRRLLFVGRFDYQKGVDVLCDALRILGDDFHAVLVGDAVVSGAADFDFPKNVTLPGWLPRTELQCLYGHAQVLVVPSRWEGFGMIAVEAMRAGCPVVASRVGGLAEIVEDGVTGVLVPPDNAAALAAAISALDDEVMHSFGQAGRERFLRLFDARKMSSGILEAYRS